MTKKRSSEILSDENRENFREKVKFGKFSTESETFFGNREGNLKHGEMHHCLSGDGPLSLLQCLQLYDYTVRRSILASYVHRSNHSAFSLLLHAYPRLRRIRPMLDLKTASTIATSIVHAKLDYCNSLFLNIDLTQINRLQAIQNSGVARGGQVGASAPGRQGLGAPK